MEKSNQSFTTAIWNVKKGKEKEFIDEWTQFANWSQKAHHVNAILLQDTDQASRFISVGRWNNEDTVSKWSQAPEFRNSMSRISDLLEESTAPRKMKEVVRVGEYEIV